MPVAFGRAATPVFGVSGGGGGAKPAPTASRASGTSSTAIRANSMPVGAQPMSISDALNNSSRAGSAASGSGGANLQQMLSGLSGSGGGGGSQPAIAYTPSEMNISAQQNPQLAALQGDAARLRGNLAANTDQDAVLAMQRQRDDISGMAKEFGEGAAQRGLLGTGAAQQDLMKKVIEPGQQALAQTSAQMASEGRNRQLAALQGEAGMAGEQARLMQAQQNFGLQSWEARNAANLSAAQLQAQQQANQSNRVSQLASLLGSFYTGF